MKPGTHNLGENFFGTKIFAKPFGHDTNGLILDTIDKHGNRSQVTLSGVQAAMLKDLLS